MSEKCNDAELKIDQACPLCYLVTSHEEQEQGELLPIVTALDSVLRVKLARQVNVRCDNYYKYE